MKSSAWWNAYYLALGLITLSISLYCLSDGSWDFKREYFYGDVFWDMWQKLKDGDLTADRHTIFDEAHVIDGKTFAYFLPFPALIRGLQSLFNLGQFPIPSVMLATGLFLCSSVRLYLDLIGTIHLKSKQAQQLASYIGGLLIIGSPILMMLSYPLMFWEAIIWGASLFMTCGFLSHKVLEGAYKIKTLYLFSIICGLTLFTRPTMFVAASFIFILTIFLLIRNEKIINGLYLNNPKIVDICKATLVFVIFFIGICLYNYLKWGSPFEFGNFKNYTLIWTPEYYQEFAKYGHYQIDRIPEGIAFYFFPTAENFTKSFPFLQVGGGNFFEGLAKQINYREAPLSIFISLPFYEIGFISGLAVTLWGMMSSEAITFKKIYASTLPIAISSLIPLIILSGWFAHSVRYIGDLIPGLYFFTVVTLLIFIIKLDKIIAKIKYPNKLFITSVICLTLFTGITLYCTLTSNWVQKQAPLLKALAYRITPPSTAIDQEIGFDIKGNGLPYLKGNVSNQQHENGGWAIPEVWGVWSNGGSAALDFPVPLFPADRYAITLHMNLRAFITPRNLQQNIAIYVNNKYIKSITLLKSAGNEIVVEMPLSDPMDPKTQLHYLIEFKFENALSPTSLGTGEDDRLLAIGLEKAVFKKADR